eukprot:COSAG01_NODE_8081_length_2929_cov_1.668198_1_plen_148_part_00
MSVIGGHHASQDAVPLVYEAAAIRLKNARASYRRWEASQREGGGALYDGAAEAPRTWTRAERAVLEAEAAAAKAKEQEAAAAAAKAKAQEAAAAAMAREQEQEVAAAAEEAAMEVVGGGNKRKLIGEAAEDGSTSPSDVDATKRQAC